MINYRIRSIRMLFVILMTLAAGAQMAHAAKGGRSDFYQKYMSRPSEELIRIGKDYRLRKNKPDSALLFFTIVAGRYTPNMSAEEKREVVEALNMNYFIYSFTYLNYPKAYENLLRAHTISKELGETSAALYFNLGSMYQLVAGQGRQWKLYSKALDCYRKGVRLALATLADGEQALKQSGEGLNGVLQLAAPSDFGRNVLLPWLDDFKRAHPNIRLQLLLNDRQQAQLGRRYSLAPSDRSRLYLRATRKVVRSMDELVCRYVWSLIHS
mgnify:CR=1 FL=1